MAKYTTVHIYTKKGNLLPYLGGKVDDLVRGRFFSSSEARKDYIQRLRNSYEREREIELVAMFRTEGNKYFCKIKCPVNPLPVKGEFEIPCGGALIAFLQKDGWMLKQKIYPRMFE